MSAIKRELMDKLSDLNELQQQQVLEFVNRLVQPAQRYSATDLLAMPEEERNKIIAEQVELAANEVFETFEAYSEEDLDAIS